MRASERARERTSQPANSSELRVANGCAPSKLKASRELHNDDICFCYHTSKTCGSCQLKRHFRRIKLT